MVVVSQERSSDPSTLIKHDPLYRAVVLSDRSQDSWCGRWESNPHGLKPNGFSYHFGFHRHPFGCLWSGLSLHHASANRRVGAARLVSTPSPVLSRRSLARDRHFTGFPEFEQFYIAHFHASTQFCLSPLRLPIPPRPHHRGGYRSSLARRQGHRRVGHTTLVHHLFFRTHYVAR
jgi:hypothetical protein